MNLFGVPKILEEESRTLGDSYSSKLNPAQEYIHWEEGSNIHTTKRGYTFNSAYKNIEVVRRGVDLIVNSASDVKLDVKDKLPFLGNTTAIKSKRLNLLLNHKPNPFEDISSFRRNMFMDLIIEGNIFIYFDGTSLYLLPACNVDIVTHPKTYISHYLYNGVKKFYPDEIIHIKDNSTDSIYRGDSRLRSAQQSIYTLDSMLSYQDNFFTNGAVPGLVLKTKDILSQKIKDRIVSYWMQKYNPKTGGKKPVVIDGGLDIHSLNQGNFKELDFSKSIEDHESRILKSLGVPPILLNSGNNANISPNLKLFYYTTVIPIVEIVISSFEAFFAYDIKKDTSNVIALRPELKDQSDYYSSLVNNGLMLGSEAREELRLRKLEEPILDNIRIPANVAGSSTGVSGQEGGRPQEGNDDD